MDFIEKLFGIAPDGGSGLLEAALFLVLVLVLSAVVLRRRWSARPKG